MLLFFALSRFASRTPSWYNRSQFLTAFSGRKERAYRKRRVEYESTNCLFAAAAFTLRSLSFIRGNNVTREGPFPGHRGLGLVRPIRALAAHRYLHLERPNRRLVRSDRTGQAQFPQAVTMLGSPTAVQSQSARVAKPRAVFTQIWGRCRCPAVPSACPPSTSVDEPSGQFQPVGWGEFSFFHFLSRIQFGQQRLHTT